MLPRSILFFALLVILGKCQENKVDEETNILREIFQNDSLYDPNDGCDVVVGSIDSCVDCYPCQHEIILANPSHKQIEIRKGSVCDKQAYLKLCCVPKGTTLESVTDFGSRFDSSMCGIRQPFGLKLGPRFGALESEDAIFGEYPWVVAVMSKCNEQPTEFRCVGTLINSRAVLTAAHCVCGLMRQKCTLSVHAGEYRFSSNAEIYPHVKADVQKVIKHPNFYDPGLHNDIALLILETPIEQKPHIGYACLADANMTPDPFESCMLAGWGINGTGRNPPSHRDVMRSIKMLPYNRDLCQKKLRTGPFGAEYNLKETFMCAVGVNGKYAAMGDGGAALMCPVKGEANRYAQYGIMVHGRSDGLPNLFTDVTKFRDWIDLQVNENINDTIIDSYLISI